MKVLSGHQWALLNLAVREAEGWRGTMVGNPDPEPLAECDETIRQMKAALLVVAEQQKVLRKLRREARKHDAQTIYAYIGPEDGGCIDIGRFDFK
jgi:hypothetical protein